MGCFHARWGAALFASSALTGIPQVLAGDILPTGGSVASGGVAISRASWHALSIQQSSP